MKKKQYDAYFTVEASFIIPISFLLIILILQYGVFCYEKSISIQCCYLAALRASNEWNLSGNEIENCAIEEMNQLLNERNIYPLEKEITAKVTLTGIEVAISGSMEVLFSTIRKDSVESLETDAKKLAGRIVPSKYIRNYYVIKDSGGESDGNN